MQTFGQTPTSANTPLDNAWPIHTKQHSPELIGDAGLKGAHTSDKVTLHNAHPHQSHSVGYEDSTMGTSYENHGFESVHIMHGRRDKGAEHHPPKGLYDPNA